jgi:hypothetical protein
MRLVALRGGFSTVSRLQFGNTVTKVRRFDASRVVRQVLSRLSGVPTIPPPELFQFGLLPGILDKVYHRT